MARSVEVVFLGTSGGVPTHARGLPSVLVRDWNGLSILLDAGEGVQLALARMGVAVTRIDVIAITHAHGDHINGLPGLLQSMYMYERSKPLLVFGPRSVMHFLRDLLEVERYDFSFEIVGVQVEGRGGHLLWDRGGDRVTISWAPACHSVESYAYRIEWRLRPRLDPEAVKALLGSNPRLVGEVLERGETRLPNGRVVRLSDIARDKARGASIVYTGDTSYPCAGVAELARGARLLIHDSTFAEDLAEEARERGHSTGVQAARAAREAGASLLVLTHVSARYEGYEARRIEREASRVFPNVILAWDGLKLLLTV